MLDGVLHDAHEQETQPPDWLLVKDLNRTLNPFPTPEETRMGRVTVPGSLYGRRTSAPQAPASSQAVRDVE